MSEKIYRAGVEVSFGDALTQTHELVSAVEGLEQMFRGVGEEGQEVESMFLTQVDALNRLRGNVDDVTDQLKLFGEGGVQAANALEEIADPARRMAAGLELVQVAAAAATSAEARLADNASLAAAKFEIQEGATKRLLDTTRRMNPALATAAGHVEKIQDKQARANAAMQLAAKAQAPLGALEGTFSRLQDAVSGAQAKFAALPPLMQGAVLGAIGAVTAGAVALANVVGTTLTAAWKAWAETSREAQAIQDDLDDSTSRLQVSLGRLVEQVGRVQDTQAGLGQVADDTTGVLDRLGDSMEEADPQAKRYAGAIGGLTVEFAKVIPGIGGVVSGLGGLSSVLADTGREVRALDAQTQAVNPTLLLLAATLDRDAASALRAGDALDDVKGALGSAASEAIRLELALRDLDTRWNNVEEWDAPVAVETIAGAGAGAERELENQRRAGEQAKKERQKKRDEELEEWKKEMRQRQKNLKAVADMDRKFREATKVSGANPALVAKYKDDPMFIRLEAAKALIQQGKEAAATQRAEGDQVREANERTAQSYRDVEAATNAAADAAIAFGVDTVAGVATALIAGDSLGGLWKSALGDLGTFATATGKTLLAVGLGKQALELGLPGGAIIGIGAGLIGLGSTLSGLFGSGGRFAGGAGGARGGAGAQISAQRDTWAPRNEAASRPQDAPAVTVVAQFSDDRLEPTVVRLAKSAERNGRTASPGRI